MRISRAQRSVLGDWWYSIDVRFLLALLVLMAVGLLASLAASPPVALRLQLDPFFFVQRHAVMLVLAIFVLIGASVLSTRAMLGLAVLVFIAALLLLFLTPFIGTSAKGSRRWIELAGVSVQASEFIKPAFIIVTAWLFSMAQQSADRRWLGASIGLFVLVLLMLVAQPDYGQSILLTLIWGGLFFLAGMPWLWLLALSGLASGGLVMAYLVVPHVGKRIDRFLDPASGDNYQVGHALRSFVEGGWFGRGPGEGTIKHVLPDAHADFIFAVLAEEFGILVCLVLLFVFAYVVWRGFIHASADNDPFRKLALAGLMLGFGLQSALNLGINMGILPAKGMTLPFISYGGSSLLAVALGMGLALGLSRRHRGEARYERSLAGLRRGSDK
jgi:cell division protein FtsW